MAHLKLRRWTRYGHDRLYVTTAGGNKVGWVDLIIMTGHAQLTGWIRRRPQGVQVLPSWVCRWWFRIPGRAPLAPGEVDELYAAAANSLTWANR